MDKSIDPVKQTKQQIRDLIFAVVDFDEDKRAWAAGRVADHLIDELVAKLPKKTTVELDANLFIEAMRQMEAQINHLASVKSGI